MDYGEEMRHRFCCKPCPKRLQFWVTNASQNVEPGGVEGPLEDGPIGRLTVSTSLSGKCRGNSQAPEFKDSKFAISISKAMLVSLTKCLRLSWVKTSPNSSWVDGEAKAVIFKEGAPPFLKTSSYRKELVIEPLITSRGACPDGILLLRKCAWLERTAGPERRGYRAWSVNLQEKNKNSKVYWLFCMHVVHAWT